MRAGKLPTFEKGQIGENVVGIHGRFADDDVRSENKRNLLRVGRISMSLWPAGGIDRDHVIINLDLIK
jgi:hypothetical protein